MDGIGPAPDALWHWCRWAPRVHTGSVWGGVPVTAAPAAVTTTGGKRGQNGIFIPSTRDNNAIYYLAYLPSM